MRHQLAARYLHDQPFGFTHEDLAHHRAEAKEMRDSVRRWERVIQRDIAGSPEVAAKVRDHARTMAEWHESMAARIAALLPPEA